MSDQPTAQAVVDTSVFIAAEQGRPVQRLPDGGAVSVVTLAELRLGILMARDPRAHAQRLRTFAGVERLFEPLPVTVEVADTFADLMAAVRQQGRRPKVMDLWIAATAVANQLPLYTQDAGFDGLPGLTVVRV